MQDKIIVNRLEVRNITGVDTWERQKRQPIFITLTVYTDIKKAGTTDALQFSINYGTLSKEISKFSEASQYRTVEALALGLIQHIFSQFPSIGEATIVVEKPKALLQADSAGVELTRLRKIASNESESVLARKNMSSDIVFVNNLQSFVVVGVNPWEREERQKVLVSLRIYLDDSNIILDHLRKQYNYRTISRVVLEVIENSRFKTLEALTTAIASICIKKCKVKKITVKVQKPSALIFAESAAVEITREKEDFVHEINSVINSNQHIAYIAVGSNVGERLAYIGQAMELLQKNNCSIIDTSYLYESKPMYVLEQPHFLNGVIKIATEHTPQALLTILKEIEVSVGRLKREKNGPREVDLDILFYDNIEINEPDLTIPHPLMKERLFVLKPLCDIAADFEHPVFHCSCSYLLKKKMEGLKDSAESEEPVQVFPLQSNNFFRIGSRTLVMGILNVTPDSFSGDGKRFYVEPSDNYDKSDLPSLENMPKLSDQYKNELLDHVKQLKEDGCDIIDIGGYSTRPNADDVSLHEELRRTLPIIFAISRSSINIPISIDTFRAAVAREAVRCGANLINDVSGGLMDVDMFKTMAELNVPVCLMHMRGNPKTMNQMTDYMKSNEDAAIKALERPKYEDELMDLQNSIPPKDLQFIRTIKQELSTVVIKGLIAGLKRWNIIVDPGIGFAKVAEQNVSLFRHLPLLRSEETEFKSLDTKIQLPYWKNLSDFPLLVGASRKSFIGKILGKEDPNDRIYGTAGICSISIMSGASIIRVHDVKTMVDVAKITDAIYRA